MTNGNGSPPEGGRRPSSTCWRSTPRTCRSKSERTGLAGAAGSAPQINIQINVGANNVGPK